MLPARSRSLRDAGKRVKKKDAKPPAWREFDMSTVAGRRLRQLYGTKTAPKINYPKPRVKKTTRKELESRKPWHRGGVKDDPRNERKER